MHRKPTILRIAAAAAASVALTAAMPAHPEEAPANGSAAPWEQLRAANLRFAGIAVRLITANAPLCDRLMPATGMLLHAIGQYPVADRPGARLAFGFEMPVSVEAVVPGSAAERAGVRANDGIAAVGGVTLEADATGAAAGGTPSSAARDAVERQLAALAPGQPIVLGVVRQGRRLTAVLTPPAACRTRFELLTGGSRVARSDGETIQLSARLLDRFDDAGLAVVFAHELAHTVLRHRVTLEAAKAEKGRIARRAEDEADRLSIYLLRNAGFDPGIALAFWRGRGGKAFGGGLLRDGTHGSARLRAALIAEDIARIPPDAPPVFAPDMLETQSRGISPRE